MTTRVLVVADDLIWQERLVRLVEGVGGAARRARSLSDVHAALPCIDALIVDLTARAYDPLAVLRASGAARLRALAVAQHDDLPLRRRALAAGAERVWSYRKLFDDGKHVLEAWLAPAPAAGPQR